MAKDKPKKNIIQGEELTKHLDQMEKAGMTVTRQWFDMFRTAVMYVWGEQLHNIRKNPDWDYVVINYIYPLIMQGIAKLAKNNPKLLGRAWDDNEADWAETWAGLIQYVWDHGLNMRYELIRAILDSAVYGYAVGYTYWDPRTDWDAKSHQPIGDVRHRLIHPATFWCDPGASRLEDAHCLGYVRKVRLDWAINQWPKFEKQLRTEASESQEFNQYEYGDGLTSLRDNVPLYENQPSRSIRDRMRGLVSLILGRGTAAKQAAEQDDTQYVWIRNCWWRDPAMEEVKIEDNVPENVLIESGQARVADDGSGRILDATTGEPFEDWPKQKVYDHEKPVFPRGRFILRAGKTVLNPDIKQQIYTRKHWPFNLLPYHIMSHMWQGSNAVEMCRGSQDMLNITVSHLVQHVKMSADPTKIIEAGSAARDRHGKVRKIKGIAGEIIVMEAGKLDKIKNLPAERLGPEVLQLIEFLRRDIETQQYMHPTAQGAQGPRKLTATEAARLDTNAHDLIALRSILVDFWVEGTGRSIAELIQEKYDTNRRVRIVGPTGQMTAKTMTQEMLSVEFDLEIEPGSTLPFDEERRKQDYLTAYQLLENPIANPMLEDVLRVLEIRNRQRILAMHQPTQLFRQFVALGAQMMQLAQAGPGSPEEGVQVAAAAEGLRQQAIMLLQQAGQLAARPQGKVPQPQGVSK